ncbi:MAG: hypothetical protein ACRD2Z_08480 [Thermoanaerobaculia bacterium]
MARKRRDRDPWQAATWEGASESTLLMSASLTLSERLDWLEEMGRVAEHLQQQWRAGASRPSGCVKKAPRL